MTNIGGSACQWTPPPVEGKFATGLRLHNSMTGTETNFIPLNPDGRTVKWYGCGPTVYDATHMGHARTYVTFDILRRVMTDHFGYRVNMCMNVTDIDDKIISRSSEQGIGYRELALKWELEFWEDMGRLNVRMPDVVTRVSEYIEENKAAIEKIVSNGFAYEAKGSVYFDTQAFTSSERHSYPRMEPGAFQDAARVLEGEGSLGVGLGRKSERDFALWKAAKPGEPSWESPWGPGRPGWHIECSAMSCAILGFPIDIHSGGIDLRFPHHDNEIAQCEAMYNEPHWVKYFLHTGHLNIYGAKMSKSEKNFVTIKDALTQFTPNQIRFLFLMNRWDRPLNYSPGGETMRAAVDVHKIFSNFFCLVKTRIRESKMDVSQAWTGGDVALDNFLTTTAEQVHLHLCDNCNTADAIVKLQGLVSQTNKYMGACETGWEGESRLKGLLLVKVARYVFKMLKIFGVINGDEESLQIESSRGLGPSCGTAFVNESSTTGVRTNLVPYVDCLVDFRSEIRNLAQELASESKAIGVAPSEHHIATLKTKIQELLVCCDAVRDDKLVNLDIQLEDTGNGGTLWKEKSKDEILRERESKAKEVEEKKLKKEENAKAQAIQLAKKQAQIATPPEQYFSEWLSQEYDISSIDDAGLPTRNATGGELSKSQRDKARKILEKQRKTHEQYMTELEKQRRD